MSVLVCRKTYLLAQSTGGFNPKQAGVLKRQSGKMRPLNRTMPSNWLNINRPEIHKGLRAFTN